MAPAHLTTSALTEASVRRGSFRRHMTSGPIPPAAMPLQTRSAAKLEGAHTTSRALRRGAGKPFRSSCNHGTRIKVMVGRRFRQSQMTSQERFVVIAGARPVLCSIAARLQKGLSGE